MPLAHEDKTFFKTRITRDQGPPASAAFTGEFVAPGAAADGPAIARIFDRSGFEPIALGGQMREVVIVGVEDNGTGNPSEVQERPAEVVRET